MQPTFNGATAFQRWKHGSRRLCGGRRSLGPPPFSDGNSSMWLPVRPSMGPPPFSDGNQSRSREATSFNGATAFQRWKLVATSLRVETGKQASNIHTSVKPSMGPPPFSDGNQGSNLQCQRWACLSGGVAVRPSMGPPPFSDGNVCRSPWELVALTRPSMGPPPFSDGNRKDSPLDLNKLEDPSMGPPPFSDGNQGYAKLEDPSMGPPPFSDGNILWACAKRGTFNGATAFQRWKHGPSPPMGPPPFSDWSPLRAFNGATAFQRWKLSIAKRKKARRSFNGATAFQRWKLAACWVVVLAQPSMGPPPFSDGNRSLWLVSVMDS